MLWKTEALGSDASASSSVLCAGNQCFAETVVKEDFFFLAKL